LFPSVLDTAEVRSASSAFRGLFLFSEAASRRGEIGLNSSASASDSKLIKEIGGILGLMHIGSLRCIVSRVRLLSFMSKGKAFSLATRVSAMRITPETMRPIRSSTAVTLLFTSTPILERITAFAAMRIL
jgi:hypothetical protein